MMKVNSLDLLDGFRLFFLHGEVFSKIDFSCFRRFKDLFPVTLNNNLTTGNYDCPISDFKCIANVVVSYKNTYSTLSQKLDNALDVSNSNGINSSKRFIQQKKLWLDGQ